RRSGCRCAFTTTPPQVDATLDSSCKNGSVLTGPEDGRSAEHRPPTHGGLSAGTAHHVHRALRNALNVAVRRGVLGSNPVLLAAAPGLDRGGAGTVRGRRDEASAQGRRGAETERRSLGSRSASRPPSR